MNKETIDADLKSAIKSRDTYSVSSLRALKAAISSLETQKVAVDVDEAQIIKTIQKMIAQRREALSIFEENGRLELADIERGEIEALEKYLPEQVSRDDMTAIIGRIINNSGALSIKDMGRVMGEANKELAGKADGKVIAEIVRGFLC